MGLEVTAEGIETRAQLDRLVELGCERGQGYLIGRAIRIEHVAGMLLTEHLDLRHVKPVVRSIRSVEEEAKVAG